MLLFFVRGPLPLQAASDPFLVLCYHDVPKTGQRDNYSVDRKSLVRQIEYLRTHGYTFISLEDARRARAKKKPLPPRSVLLTFDDGYRSFYDFVFPLLKVYKYPCVLAVVTGWIDRPPPEIVTPLLDWRQLREIAESGLVEIASHTHDLHRTVRYNPQGNDSWAAVSRVYDPVAMTYEDESAYRSRIHADLLRSRETLKNNLGVEARSLVWPFGEYNTFTVEEARACGFVNTFMLEDRPAAAENLETVPRFIVTNMSSVMEFARPLKNPEEAVHQRILQADLDLIYDPDPAQQERNLDAFIERVVRLQADTVYLQAFCDDEGDGNIASVYFPNRVLPMKADLFNRVVNQLAVREIFVYAWMPTLSVTLPDPEENDRLRVVEFSGGKKQLSRSWYHRLSPFSAEAVEKLEMLYGDMAAHARIDGVIFQDDGYLTDFEDYNPAALEEYREIGGDEDIPCQQLGEGAQRDWTRAKTKKLIALTETLKNAVRRYRPQARFARTLYAPVLIDPGSEEWLAQNYADTLAAYDYAVIMAYPFMEGEKFPEKWLKQLVDAAKKYPDGLKKTVFKVQAYDWDKKRWVKTDTILRWLRTLVSQGALHVAYYPDNYLEDKPEANGIRRVISAEDFPFRRSDR
ncbi:MAG: poly-beta-1,6-N-acetyl-D-glucosamine N-deacetylase PgaB [Endomicrobiales bacterium]